MSETLFAQANPTGVSGYATTTENGSYGVLFTVTAACNLTAIWFYSPSGASSLPTSTALYSTVTPGSSGTLIAQNSSPSWSGAAGSGWVRDNSFPATALSTGVTYCGQYYSASFKQGYLYTGSFPGPWFPATSSPSGLATAATQYFGGVSNAPYLNSANGFPSSQIGAGVNWLCDVEVSTGGTGPAQIAGPAQYRYLPPAWHPSSGPGMPGGEPFASYAAASYSPLIPAEVPQPGPFRLFPATSGPSSAKSSSGDWISGVAFQVTEGGQWFEGYWWWVCASGQSTSPVTCALWNAYQPASVSGTLVSGSVVTSGTLTAGAWNWIPLATPVPLAVATTYIAAIGVNGNYPDTTAQFGSGDPYSAGITDGPLSAFSGQNGSNPDPYTLIGNGIYSTAGTDPSVTIPGTLSATYDNLWVDVQVSGTPPAGYAGPYQVWPAKADADTYTTADSSVNYVVGTEFWLSQPCTVNSVRYFSPAGTAQLATEVTIWNTVTKAAVYDNTSPSWSGAAASGWVSCPVTGVTLQPGAYRVTVFNNAGSPDGWSAKRFGYWGGGGTVPGGGPQVTGNGITLGPLYVPSAAQASNCYEYDSSGAGSTPPFSFPDGRQEPGQSVFADSGSNTYPALYVDGAFQNYWVDLSVSLATVSAPAVLTGSGSLSGSGVFAGSGALSGSGTLAETVTLIQPAITLSGSGTLSGTGAFAGAAVLSGSGTLSVPGVTLGYTAPLSGSGSLTAAGVFAGASALMGSGSLAAGNVILGYSAPLSGSGSLAASGAVAGTAALSGSGTLSGLVALGYAAVLTGSGTLAGSGVFAGTASLSGTGSLSVPGVTLGYSAVLSGSGLLTAAGVLSAAASLSGSGSLSVPGAVLGYSATLTGSGTLTGTAAGVSGAALSGLGTLQAGTVILGYSAAFSGTGTLTGAGAFAAAAGMAGSGTLSGAILLAGTATLTGSGTVSAAWTVASGSAAALSGAGTLGGAGTVIFTAAVTLSGAGTLTATVTLLTPTPFTGPWHAGPLAPRWHAVPLLTRWRVTRMQYEPISALSVEYVPVLWTSDLAGTWTDPTGQTAGENELLVQFAVPVSSGNPLQPAEPSTWYAAVWLLGGNMRGYVAQACVGPTGGDPAGLVQLTAGTDYDLWCQILGNPEQPVKFAGVLPVI